MARILLARVFHMLDRSETVGQIQIMSKALLGKIEDNGISIRTNNSHTLEFKLGKIENAHLSQASAPARIKAHNELGEGRLPNRAADRLKKVLPKRKIKQERCFRVCGWAIVKKNVRRAIRRQRIDHPSAGLVAVLIMQKFDP